MNFKTVIRLAKQAHNKCVFATGKHKVVNADGYVMIWVPFEEPDGAWDLDDQPCDPPPLVEQAKLITDALSPPLEEMIKVNSNYLRRLISAMETKGNEPLYLDIKNKRIVLAYVEDGVTTRGAVACMNNEQEQ